MTEYKRIYHSHIRKCAGTSFNKLILGKECDQNQESRDKIYSSLCRNSLLILNDKIYLCHNNHLINQGNYYYAFSHSPYWSLKFDDDTFIFTNFRNPVKRVISHYQMIKEYCDEGNNHSCMMTEGKWLGKDKTFKEFLSNMPIQHSHAQLYHYSKNLDISEALVNIGRINFVGRVETLSEKGYQELGKICPNLTIPNEHLRKSKPQKISEDDYNFAKEILKKEFDLIQNIKFSY